MSQQSDHQFWHPKTTLVKYSWFEIYPLSLIKRKRHRRQRQSRCRSWSSLSNKNLFWRFGYVFVDHIHDTNPRTNSVTKERFDQDLHTVTSLMIADLHIQNWTDLRVSTDPPSHVGWFLTSRQKILSTWSQQFIKCIIIKCNEELCILKNSSRNQQWSSVWSIFLVQVDLLISAHIHATSFLVLRHQSEEFDKLSEILSV